MERSAAPSGTRSADGGGAGSDPSPPPVDWDRVVDELRGDPTPERREALWREAWGGLCLACGAGDAAAGVVAERLREVDPSEYDALVEKTERSGTLTRILAVAPPSTALAFLQLVRPTYLARFRLRDEEVLELDELFALMARNRVFAVDPPSQPRGRGAAAGQRRAEQVVAKGFERLRARAQERAAADPDPTLDPWEHWALLSPPTIPTRGNCVILQAEAMGATYQRLAPGAGEDIGLRNPHGRPLPLRVNRPSGPAVASRLDLVCVVPVGGDKVETLTPLQLVPIDPGAAATLRCPLCAAEVIELYLPPPRRVFRCAGCTQRPPR